MTKNMPCCGRREAQVIRAQADLARLARRAARASQTHKKDQEKYLPMIEEGRAILKEARAARAHHSLEHPNAKEA